MKQEKNTKYKQCKDCDFCDASARGKYISIAMCFNHQYLQKDKEDLSLLNGKEVVNIIQPYCKEARNNEKLCGKEAKGFIPRKWYTPIKRNKAISLYLSILVTLLVLLVINL
jgi:hypothetical protein